MDKKLKCILCLQLFDGYPQLKEHVHKKHELHENSERVIQHLELCKPRETKKKEWK